ncbi:hypothetical protein QYF36_014655 [Acer negundo]|nr:hypothetical protein QYF36_014655 [Acer negundo]
MGFVKATGNDVKTLVACTHNHLPVCCSHGGAICSVDRRARSDMLCRSLGGGEICSVIPCAEERFARRIKTISKGDPPSEMQMKINRSIFSPSNPTPPITLVEGEGSWEGNLLPLPP